jgi:glycosyltransferase involved in cell wall biosynthesis
VKSPLISCIVPVFNGERYLGETLDSILAQTYQPLEILVVDDGSTDGTGALVAQYGRRLRHLWQTNAGEAAARNLGLAAAQGEFVAFVDADDLWQPEKLQRQMARFQEPAPIDLCFTQYKNFWVHELAEEESKYRGQMLSQPQSAWSISTLLARLAAFERFGKFSTAGKWPPESENTIWFLHAAEQGALIEVMPEVLMSRRFHPSNQSRKKTVETFLPILKEWRDYQRRRLTS